MLFLQPSRPKFHSTIKKIMTTINLRNNNPRPRFRLLLLITTLLTAFDGSMGATTGAGMGYCSDDPLNGCLTVDSCDCFARLFERTLLRHHRNLQTSCDRLSRKKCKNTPSCEWKNNLCVPKLLTPPPTQTPTPPPTPLPTVSPTEAPVECKCLDVPTSPPTTNPPSTASPTNEPTSSPSTASPTNEPTSSPSTAAPTGAPTSTNEPTSPPTGAPTKAPVIINAPTSPPTNPPPSSAPSNRPTTALPTKAPTGSPTTAAPTTSAPTSSPVKVTSSPSKDPTQQPSSPPTPTPQPTPLSLQVVTSDLLTECQGNCADDEQCVGGSDMQCFHRSFTEAVPGCEGVGPYGVNFCARRPTENTVWLKGDNGNPEENFPLGLCEGDCDGNYDCQLGLICQQRSSNESIPGCTGTPQDGEDYCRYPELKFRGNPPPSLLGNCEGDCDSDSDCNKALGPLECFQRSGTEVVPGCLGAGTSGTDYCALRRTKNTLFLKGNDGLPTENFPLKLCEGDCDKDSECAEGLKCLPRSGDEEVPGCIGIGTWGKDYCYDPNWESPGGPPTSKPTYAPNSYGATFVPGDLSVPCEGLMLSKGMACRKLTTADMPVQFDTGGQSTDLMHKRADAAVVIAHPNDGGWYYVSNSETSASNGGGVGTLRFNAAGQVIGYKRDLYGTSYNCGGGKTYWGTFVSCEEFSGAGHCWEVDPNTGHTAQTNVVPRGGNYESFAFDDQDLDVEARFFTTEDSGSGPLVRYTPSTSAFKSNNNYDILTSQAGTYDYLVLNESDMTFQWSSDATAGATSASTFFPNAEGIDVFNRKLFFVSKVKKVLFELDLANLTWTKSSTLSGAFENQPDQIARIVGDGNYLYFCEDGGSACDVHGRDIDGNFFTLIRGDGYSTETTGLAFSPDAKFMYVSFQGNSNVFSFWREDGLPFSGVIADIKYH